MVLSLTQYKFVPRKFNIWKQKPPASVGTAGKTNKTSFKYFYKLYIHKIMALDFNHTVECARNHLNLVRQYFFFI